MKRVTQTLKNRSNQLPFWSNQLFRWLLLANLLSNQGNQEQPSKKGLVALGNSIIKISYIKKQPRQPTFIYKDICILYILYRGIYRVI